MITYPKWTRVLFAAIMAANSIVSFVNHQPIYGLLSVLFAAYFAFTAIYWDKIKPSKGDSK